MKAFSCQILFDPKAASATQILNDASTFKRKYWCDKDKKTLICLMRTLYDCGLKGEYQNILLFPLFLKEHKSQRVDYSVYIANKNVEYIQKIPTIIIIFTLMKVSSSRKWKYLG